MFRNASPSTPVGPPGGLDVLLSGPANLNAPGVVEHDDGSLTVDLDPSAAAPSLNTLGHDGNLAEVLPERLLDRIACDLIEGIEADTKSNADWHAQCEEGVRLLGLKPEQRSEPFDGAAGVYHPLLLEAVLRFHAGARAEMCPAAGPVRMQVPDGATTAADPVSQRKQAFLNFYLTSVYEGYYDEHDQMLLYLAVYGSCFKKVYNDPLERRPVAPFILPKQLIVSYAADDVETARRVTHETLVSRSDVIRLQLRGVYRNIDLVEPDEDAEETIAEVLEGRKRDLILGDDRRTLWEVHCDLDIAHPGIEHVGPDGQPTGLPLPYIVTLDKDSRRVLALRRNWQEGDADCQRRQWFVHYRLMPGLGFYGWGYAHILGSSADAATKLRRQMIDGLTLSNFPGGFRTKGMRLESNKLSLGPCEFAEVDTGGMPIQQAIMPLPYKEPGGAYGPTLEDIVSSGQRLGGTMDLAVGDGREDAPVGTTLALIEKATRIESAIVKRLHAAHRKELRLLAALFAQAPPETQYPFKVGGGAGMALAADFAQTDDIVPVSDPNVPTQTQRLAVAQAKLTLAQSAPPGTHDIRAAYQAVYQAMGIPEADISKLMPPPQQAQPLDPVSENMAAMRNQPLAVGPQQAHAAHIAVHMGMLQAPGVAKLPAAAALVSHIAEHMAWEFRNQAAAALLAGGMQLPPPGQPLPPQIENQIAAAVAAKMVQISAQLQQLAGTGMGLDPLQAEANRLQEQANQLKAVDQQIKQADAERKAQETARQDQVELFKLAENLKDNAADRQARLAEAQINLEAERIRAAAAMQSSQVSHAGNIAKAASSVETARAGIAQEALRTAGAVRAEQAAAHTEHVKGQHAEKVAEHNAKAATARARQTGGK
jgi:hypothetical protein